MNCCKGFFTSGRDFEESQNELKSKYQMVNIAILLSGVGLLFGIIVNIVKGIPGYVTLEALLLFIDILLFITLRVFKSSLQLVSTIVTAQFTFLFLFLIYVGKPEEMKHLWVLTYPIIILFFQEKKRAIFWFIIIFSFLLISPFQSFIEIQYSLSQIIYLSMVLFIVSLIIYFYQFKMNEARDLILEQQILLRNFNLNLEYQVVEKTAELQELNESLEAKVQQKIDELVQKDKILTVQSKQAVMGEMISMIAHQWRQPLSTITLQISNLQFKKLLGQGVSDDDMDKALSNISDTIIYLSDTVDDFQAYFHTDKEKDDIGINELLEKATNLVLARTKESNIDIVIDSKDNIIVKTYTNEFIQVVLNIINNAIDALSEVKVDNPTININVNHNSELLTIDITDNAGGISDENISKLFEPYFSTKGKNGTGLGLYMCQTIVQKQLNGEIKVQSSKEGSTFTIEVPIDRD